MAPMVHWPEVMVEYESTEKVLFSVDGFGTFGALGDRLKTSELENMPQSWADEARRYFINIVGKYGPSAATNLLSSGTSMSINCGSIANVFAFATTIVSGYFFKNRSIFPE